MSIIFLHLQSSHDSAAAFLVTMGANVTLLNSNRLGPRRYEKRSSLIMNIKVHWDMHAVMDAPKLLGYC